MSRQTDKHTSKDTYKQTNRETRYRHIERKIKFAENLSKARNDLLIINYGESYQ